VLSAQAGTEELRDFAEMVGTELVVIDEATTIPVLRDHLRWSAACHRLAAGL
jgi:L-arabinose isomerase